MGGFSSPVMGNEAMCRHPGPCFCPSGGSILLQSAVCGAVCIWTATSKENMQTGSVSCLKKAVKGEKDGFLKTHSPAGSIIVKLPLGNTQSCLQGYLGYEIVVKN